MQSWMQGQYSHSIFERSKSLTIARGTNTADQSSISWYFRFVIIKLLHNWNNCIALDQLVIHLILYNYIYLYRRSMTCEFTLWFIYSLACICNLLYCIQYIIHIKSPINNIGHWSYILSTVLLIITYESGMINLCWSSWSWSFAPFWLSKLLKLIFAPMFYVSMCVINMQLVHLSISVAYALVALPHESNNRHKSLLVRES